MKGPKHIILDLSQIDFVDSSGLGALVQLAKQAQTAEGTLQIVTNARVTQTVKLVRLEKFLSLQSTVDATVENIKGAWPHREIKLSDIFRHSLIYRKVGEKPLSVWER